MHKFSGSPVIKIPGVILTMLLLFIFISPVYPQAEADRLVLKGLDYCYHFNWSNAEDSFKKIIEKYPASPKGYHYLSSVYFWYYLSNKNESDYNSFKKYSDQAVDIAGDLLEKKENDPELLYLLGSNYNYRTVAFAKAENYVDAIWAAKKSESYLSDCIEADSTMYDAYLGLGLYNFAMANIPSAFKWALNLAGISGEENTGLRYIKTTAEKGKLAKTEAQYYLAQILMESVLDFDAAAQYMKNLTKKFPENLLFNYSSGVAEIKRKKLDEGEKILSKIAGEKEPKFQQIISFTNFLMGDIFFRKNKFEEAKKYYLNFLNSANDKDYTGIASYRLAVCFEITGDRNNAKKYFSFSEKGSMDIEDDIFAKRKGDIYSKRTMAVTELELIRAGNFVESGNYQGAIDSLVILLSEIKTEKAKAEAYLLISEAAYNLSRYDESVDYALNAAKLNSADENWIKPFAFYYAARASKKKGNRSLVEKYVNEAEDYSGYDYQKKLDNLIKALLRNF